MKMGFRWGFFRLLFAALVVLGLALAQDLRIYFLNVGQGDAILVVSPEGKTLAYDAGGNPERAADLITAPGINKIDVAVMSQGDRDHIGGFLGIARRLKPTFFVNNGLAKNTDTYRDVLLAFQAAGSGELGTTKKSLLLWAMRSRYWCCRPSLIYLLVTRTPTAWAS